MGVGINDELDGPYGSMKPGSSNPFDPYDVRFFWAEETSGAELRKLYDEFPETMFIIYSTNLGCLSNIAHELDAVCDFVKDVDFRQHVGLYAAVPSSDGVFSYEIFQRYICNVFFVDPPWTMGEFKEWFMKTLCPINASWYAPAGLKGFDNAKC